MQFLYKILILWGIFSYSKHLSWKSSEMPAASIKRELVDDGIFDVLALRNFHRAYVHQPCKFRLNTASTFYFQRYLVVVIKFGDFRPPYFALVGRKPFFSITPASGNLKKVHVHTILKFWKFSGVTFMALLPV